MVEPDRRAAIALAIEAARPGDVVVMAGKGHETTQEIGGVSVPFDDRVETLRWSPRSGRGRPRGRGADAVLSLMESGGVACWVAILGTPLLMRWLTRRRIGQHDPRGRPGHATA